MGRAIALDASNPAQIFVIAFFCFSVFRNAVPGAMAIDPKERIPQANFFIEDYLATNVAWM
jgi:hypothetical protein